MKISYVKFDLKMLVIKATHSKLFFNEFMDKLIPKLVVELKNLYDKEHWRNVFIMTHCQKRPTMK